MAVTLCTVLAACGDSGDDRVVERERETQRERDDSITYVTEVAGTDLFLGIRVDETGEVLAYVCDNEAFGRWMDGRANEGRVDVASADGTRITATLKNHVAKGELSVQAMTYSFEAPVGFGEAGLYRRAVTEKGKRVDKGWVVLSDGAVRGAISDEPAPTDEVSPIPPPPGLGHRFLGDHPTDVSHYGDNPQGIADDETSRWFLSGEKKLFTVPFSVDLARGFATPLPAGVRVATMPDSLAQQGYDHYGDLDYHRNYLFVPVTGRTGTAVDKPIIAAFKASDLSLVATAVIAEKAGWLAVDPRTGMIWTSHSTVRRQETFISVPNQVYESVHGYTVDYAQLDTNRQLVVTFSPNHQFFPKSSGKYQVLEHMQGGVFRPDGKLYLVNGINNDNVSPEGIGLYSFPEGNLLAHSCNSSVCSFRLQWNTSFPVQQEPEGATWLTTGTSKTPKITGDLHVMLADNDCCTTDDTFVKHYDNF